MPLSTSFEPKLLCTFSNLSKLHPCCDRSSYESLGHHSTVSMCLGIIFDQTKRDFNFSAIISQHPLLEVMANYFNAGCTHPPVLPYEKDPSCKSPSISTHSASISKQVNTRVQPRPFSLPPLQPLLLLQHAGRLPAGWRGSPLSSEEPSRSIPPPRDSSPPQ